MLYIFDVDDTLIEGWLATTRCEVCGGSGCPVCRGKGRIFGEPLPYETVNPMPGVTFKLSHLLTERPQFALATNQPGVAMGIHTKQQVWDKLGRVISTFDGFGSAAVSIHVAMHLPPERNPLPGYSDPFELTRRKPGPGMVIEAMHNHGVMPENTVFVGDLATDKGAADAAGVRFEWAHEFFGRPEKP